MNIVNGENMEDTKITTTRFLRYNYFRLGIACFLCYCGCYLGKNILSAISPYLQTNGVYDAEQIGTMGSYFFFAYGFGQLVNGFLGDYIGPKKLSFVGLLTSGVLVTIVPFISGIALNNVLWAVVGFFSSMMWGPLTKIVAENSEGETGRKLMLLLNAASIIGTLLSYLIAVVVSAFFQWQIAFYSTGLFMVLCSICYFCLLTYLEKRNIIVCSGIKSNNLKQRYATEKLSVNLVMKHAIIPTVIYCMVNGFIRNAVSFWIPIYIKEFYNIGDAFASAIAIVLPIFNLIGSYIGIALLEKRIFRKSEHNLNFVLFLITVLTFAVIVILNGKSLLLTVICLVIASASMSTACNLIFAVYVFRYTNTGRISTFSGALDCTAYVASGVGTRFISMLVGSFGWNVTVLVWSFLAGFGGLCCFSSSMICRKNGVEAQSE